MRIRFGLIISAAIALAFGAGCDDNGGKKPTATEKHATSSTGAARLGAGWHQTAQGKVSAWGFATVPDPVEGIRTALFANVLPPKESVNVAALINLFAGGLPKPPTLGDAFRPTVVLTTTPWNDDTLLLFVGVAAASAQIPRDLVATPDRPAITVEFDPKTVGAFRPLGDAASLPLQDGTTQTAIMVYEISPLYNTLPQPGTHYGKLNIHYRTADDAKVETLEEPIDDTDYVKHLDDALPVIRFSAAVAGFGGLLSADPAVRDLSCKEVIALAQGAVDVDPDGVRAGLIGLMQLAAPLIDLPPPESGDDLK